VKSDPTASKLPSVIELLEALDYANSIKAAIKPVQRRSKRRNPLLLPSDVVIID
jgi:hypothetical protein